MTTLKHLFDAHCGLVMGVPMALIGVILSVCVSTQFSTFSVIGGCLIGIELAHYRRNPVNNKV